MAFTATHRSLTMDWLERTTIFHWRPSLTRLATTLCSDRRRQVAGLTLSAAFPDPATGNDAAQEPVSLYGLGVLVEDDVLISDNSSVTLVTGTPVDPTPPTKSQDITATFAESDAQTNIDLGQFISEADGDPLTFTVDSTNGDTSGTSVTGSTLTVNPSQYAASLNAGQSEVITYTYTVSDADGSVQATATITITGRG